MKKYKVYYTLSHHGFIEVESEGILEAEGVVWDMLHDGEITESDALDSDYLVEHCAEVK